MLCIYRFRVQQECSSCQRCNGSMDQWWGVSWYLMHTRPSSCLIRELFSYFGQKCLFSIKVPAWIYRNKYKKGISSIVVMFCLCSLCSFVSVMLCLCHNWAPWTFAEGWRYLFLLCFSLVITTLVVMLCWY